MHLYRHLYIKATWYTLTLIRKMTIFQVYEKGYTSRHRSCNQTMPFVSKFLRPYTMVKTIQQHSTLLFQFPTLHIIFSLLFNTHSTFTLFNGFFFQHFTPPLFISYSYLILYFCFFDHIKLQLSIIIKLK